MLLFLLFLHFHSCCCFFFLSLSFISSTLFSLSLGDNIKRPTRVDVSLNPNKINQSRRAFISFWKKNVHNTGLPLRGISLPSKMWLG